MPRANDAVPTLLAVCLQLAIGELIAGHTLVPDDSGAFENRERASAVDYQGPPMLSFVGFSSDGGVDRVIVGEFDVKDLWITVVSVIVDDHSEPLRGHRRGRA